MEISALAQHDPVPAFPPAGNVAEESAPAQVFPAPAEADASKDSAATEAGRAAPAEENRRTEGNARPKEPDQAAEQNEAPREPPSGIRELTPEEKQRVAELKAIDLAVRTHERAHVAAAGNLIRSGSQFGYVTGPDGQRYAVSGEVQIDTSGVPNDPEATIQKAQQIRRAALAPAQPSSQDQRVAAQASQLEFSARAEAARDRTEESREQREDTSAIEALFNNTGSAVQPRVVDLFG